MREFACIRSSDKTVSPGWRSRAGFTLIELLVVIAIIAILASLLLPALKDARNRAFDVSCKTTLHDWGVAFSVYHQDHDGEFEPADSNGLDRYWPHTLRNYYEEKRILFIDGHVQRVGLKLLWTLKWHPIFRTDNRWTKQGGMSPDHWPAWMRSFEDE
jgi:prepilin-type N-terminal cleavage/methylation domain-containing protein